MAKIKLPNRVVAAAAAAIIGVGGAYVIQSSEGTYNKVYLDPIGIPTVCNGHTGPDVHMGDTWTDAQCEQVLKQDIIKHQKVLVGPGNCVNGNLKPMTNRLDAVTSFTFNVGTGNFCKSTMAAKIRVKDYAGASREFPKWVYAGGKKFNGLVTRRDKEQTLFDSTAPWKPYYFKEVIRP